MPGPKPKAEGLHRQPMHMITQQDQKLTDLIIKATAITTVIDRRTKPLGFANLKPIERHRNGPLAPRSRPRRWGVAVDGLADGGGVQAAVGESSAISSSSSQPSTL